MDDATKTERDKVGPDSSSRSYEDSSDSLEKEIQAIQTNLEVIEGRADLFFSKRAKSQEASVNAPKPEQVDKTQFAIYANIN